MSEERSDIDLFFDEIDASLIAGTVHIRPMVELVDDRERCCQKAARWPVPYQHDEIPIHGEVAGWWSA